MKTNLIKTELTLAQSLIINLIGAINLMPKTWITFALKTPNLMDYEPSMIDTLTDTFKECFPYDSQACFNHSPQIKYLNGLFTIIVPFTC